MSDEWILLLLRLAASTALLAFLGMIGWLLWRDYQQAAESLAGRSRERGRLTIIRVEEDSAYQVGQSWPILALTTLGRAPTNTIQLNEPVVSNEHALIEWRGGQWWLEDLKSSNGTRLNDHHVEEPSVISSLDEITLGTIRFRVELER